MKHRKIILFANTDWYLYNFRLSLARMLRSAGWDVVLVSPPGDYGHKLEQEGFRWIPFSFSTRSTNPLSELWVVIRLILLYRREAPDVCHHFTIKCVLYGSIAARLSGIGNIVNAVTGLGYVFENNGFVPRLLRLVVKQLYRLVLNNKRGRVIFQNRSNLDSFVRFALVNPEYTCLIRGSGVDCTKFSQLVEPSDTSIVNIVFASRLLREKGVYELVDAARKIIKKGYSVTFFIAGEIYTDNPSSLTETEVAEIEREGVVTLLGQVENMPDLLHRCHIAVLPSYHEGTPRFLLEAAACGLPIVASDIPGCRGVVGNGVNGYLVQAKTVEPLAVALMALIIDPGLRKQFGREGREIILREFDETIVLDKTMKVYEEILSR